MKKLCSSILFLLSLVLLAGTIAANGQNVPPSFSVRYIGTGSVVAINNVNTLVGYRTNPSNGIHIPLISVAGGAWVPLPVPAGASGAFPTDINDLNVIVGVANMTSGRRAIRWTPTGAGYAVEVLPLLPGELASYGTGINNLGQVVGARAGILGTPYGFGWLYTDAGGLVNINAHYGWFATPEDINDASVILAGTQTFDLTTETVTDVGLNGPSNYNAIGGVDINNYGMIVGYASLRSTSLNIISVFRYVPGTAGSSFQVPASTPWRTTLTTGATWAGANRAQGFTSMAWVVTPWVACWTAAAAARLGHHRQWLPIERLPRGRDRRAQHRVRAVRRRLLTPVGLLPPPAAPTA